MKRLSNNHSSSRRAIRHTRVRSRVVGTLERPRLSVHRGLKSMTAQLIDDSSGKTLAYVNSQSVKAEKQEGKGAKMVLAYAVGVKLAELAKTKKITKVVFDRGGYSYHGRVAAVADGARATGLQF